MAYNIEAHHAVRVAIVRTATTPIAISATANAASKAA